MLARTPTILAALLLPGAALAQTPAPTVDLTGIAASFIAAFFGFLTIVVPLLINSHMKNKEAALALGNAVKNSLGAMQQAAQGVVATSSMRVALPGVPANLVPAVQYVLDNAGDEAARFGVTPAGIANKVSAQIGLANIATNQATAASPAPTPRPLDPVPAAASVQPASRVPSLTPAA